MTKKSKRKKIALWVEGARLRTLPLAIAPVALGTGAAASIQLYRPELAGLALLVALCLQIGVNYANDYSDGIRGTDTKRVGPLRLTGSNSVKPKAVKNAAFIFFALAGLAGLGIVLITGLWWLLAIGAVAILAAWFYTGGKSPYGYAALGEVSVFIFFGLVATLGTEYIQTLEIDSNGIFGAVAMGSISSAVLMINNIRDIDLDRHVGKKTLAVRQGKTWAKVLYLILLWLPIGLLIPFPFLYPASVFTYATLLLIIPATLIALTAKTPKELILVLKLTSFAGLAYGLLLGLGLAAVSI